jgi:hypothetical protein
MLRSLVHQYGTRPGGYGPPPVHTWGHGSLPRNGYAGRMTRGQLYGAGGLLGGAVSLGARSPTGMVRGNTGYGYLGMDPSDPSTWPRPFNPAPGMIGWLNWQSR